MDCFRKSGKKADALMNTVSFKEIIKELKIIPSDDNKNKTNDTSRNKILVIILLKNTSYT